MIIVYEYAYFKSGRLPFSRQRVLSITPPLHQRNSWRDTLNIQRKTSEILSEMLPVHSLPLLASASAGGHTKRWKFTDMTIAKLITDMQSFAIAYNYDIHMQL